MVTTKKKQSKNKAKTKMNNMTVSPISRYAGVYMVACIFKETSGYVLVAIKYGKGKKSQSWRVNLTMENVGRGYGLRITDLNVFMEEFVLKDIERGIDCFTDEGLVTFIGEYDMDNFTIQLEKDEALGETTANMIILMAQNLSRLQSRLQYIEPKFKEELEAIRNSRPKELLPKFTRRQDRTRLSVSGRRHGKKHRGGVKIGA